MIGLCLTSVMSSTQQSHLKSAETSGEFSAREKNGELQKLSSSALQSRNKETTESDCQLLPSRQGRNFAWLNSTLHHVRHSLYTPAVFGPLYAGYPP